MKYIVIVICLLLPLSIGAQVSTITFTYDDAGNRTAAVSPGYSSCETSIHITTPISASVDMYYSDFIHIETPILQSVQTANFIAGNYVFADQDFEVPLGVQAFLNTETRECLCYDGIDNDSDGLADSLDPDCQ